MANPKTRIRPWLIAAAGVAVFLLLAAGLAWAFRLQLAGWAAHQWCRGNQFECKLDVTALGLKHLEAGNIRLTDADGSVPLEARRARVEWTWEGILRPAVSRVEVEQPILRGTYTPESEKPARFGGLESLGGSSDREAGKKGQAMPDVSVRDGRVELETPAGPLVLTGSFSGQLPYQGKLQAEIAPVELAAEGNRLVVKKGKVDLSFTGFRIDGQADIELSEAVFESLSVRDANITIDMAGTLKTRLNWDANVGQFTYRNISIQGGKLSGTLTPRQGETGSAGGLLTEIESASVSGALASLSTPAFSAGSSDISLDLRREGPGSLTSDFAVRAVDITHARGTVSQASISGMAETDNTLTKVQASGDIVAEEAALSEDVRTRLVSAIDPGRPLDAHATSARAWLVQALRAFSLGSGFDVRLDGRDDWSIVSARNVSIKAASGTALTLEPRETRPALNISPEGVVASGLLSLSGGGAPEAAALIRRAAFTRGAPVEIETGGVSLKPWKAGDLSLAADINAVSLSTGPGAPRLTAVGELRVEGPLYGMVFGDTRLFGSIDAVLDPAGLRVQTHEADCLGLDMQGLSLSGGFGVGDTSFQLCPVDGRVVRQSSGTASGAVDLGTVSLPFTAQDTAGTLSLEGAVLDWQAGQGARLTIDADTIRLPLEIGGKQLNVAANHPTLSLESGRPAALSANVGRTEFSGSILPAELSLSQATLRTRLAASGLQGTARASRVEIRDPGADPLYEPVFGDLTAELSDGMMQVEGPVTTSKAGETVANVAMTLDLGSLDGNASIKSERLVFSPDRLQPTALSERLRGLLSNAHGTLTAEAIFDIDSGTPSGQGWVSVSDFGFDTLRLGAVTGVNGRIDFDDLLAMSTPPGQEVRIGSINPGIPLEDGRIVFQLKNAGEAIIEEARWPFAGGELVAGRSSWTIAGTRDTVRISARNLELSEIINVFNLPDISANGTVSGEFPVEIDGPKAYIRNATLKADETGGTLSYTGDVGDTASKADERVEMAFDALRDFRFSVLELGADGNLSGDMQITLKLIGRSPEVLKGAPFAFNIGIDSKLMQLLQTGRSLTNTDWLADITAESVRGRGRSGTEADETGEQSQ